MKISSNNIRAIFTSKRFNLPDVDFDDLMQMDDFPNEKPRRQKADRIKTNKDKTVLVRRRRQAVLAERW